jgi:Papain fold toxin 1, glutamine deamidase
MGLRASRFISEFSPPAPAATGRPLPDPPAARHDDDGRLRLLTPFRLPPATDTARTRGEGRWARINRPVPGMTTRPSINQSVSGLEKGGHRPVAAELADFVAQRFPTLPALNPTRNLMNCDQAVLAVDRVLSGDTQVRIPPSSTGGWHGLNSLQDRYGGRWGAVSGYDDVIAHLAAEPGSRGVVFVNPSEGHPHVFTAVHTNDGVVFLDGQRGGLAVLPADVAEIGLMMYHPDVVLAPPGGPASSVTAQLPPPPAPPNQDPHGHDGSGVLSMVQWAKSSYSVAGADGVLACVEVAQVRRQGTGAR